jgi:hypothetical protein
MPRFSNNNAAPLAGASWIWLDQPQLKVHQYVYFRRALPPTRNGRDAELAISVDTDFALWVNGSRPARALERSVARPHPVMSRPSA